MRIAKLWTGGGRWQVPIEVIPPAEAARQSADDPSVVAAAHLRRDGVVVAEGSLVFPLAESQVGGRGRCPTTDGNRCAAPGRQTRMGRSAGGGVAAAIAMAVTFVVLAVSGCDDLCAESETQLQTSPDQRHSGIAVHKSCGGAAGAEEDLVYVVDDDGERSLGLRVHHQVGPLVFTWIDDDHVEISLSAAADVVESSSPAGGVEISVTKAEP